MRDFIGNEFKKLPGLVFSKDYSSIYNDLIDFGIGDPDLSCHKKIIEKTFEAARDGFTHYNSSYGLEEFRKSFIDFYKEEYEIDLDLKNICASFSGSEAMFLILRSVINPGEEVIVPSPYFLPYLDAINLAHGKARFLETTFEDDFQINIYELEKLINKNTKALIINTPNNPTGTSYSQELLRKIYELARERDILIICDDIYTLYSYEEKFSPMIKFDKNIENVIAINSFSKDFLMTGFRLGAIIGPEKIIRTLNYIHESIVYCLPAFIQIGGIYALKNRQKICPPYFKEYKNRILLAYQRLKNLKNVEVMKASGSFYIFPKIRVKGLTIEEIIDKLIKEAHVNVINGKVFGPGGEDHIRIAVNVNEDKINEAFNRIEKIDIFR